MGVVPRRFLGGGGYKKVDRHTGCCQETEFRPSFNGKDTSVSRWRVWLVEEDGFLFGLMNKLGD